MKKITPISAKTGKNNLLPEALKGVGNGQTDGRPISLNRVALTNWVSYSCHYLSYLSVRSFLCSSVCMFVYLFAHPSYIHLLTCFINFLRHNFYSDLISHSFNKFFYIKNNNTIYENSFSSEVVFLRLK